VVEEDAQQHTVYGYMREIQIFHSTHRATPPDLQAYHRPELHSPAALALKIISKISSPDLKIATGSPSYISML
jgi:hypothetical protein